jgi:hypothetical protein
VSTFYLINPVTVQVAGQAMRLRAGQKIDSAQLSTASLIAAGAELWPTSNAAIATAAARVASLRVAQGIDELTAERVMRSGVAVVNQATQSGQGSDAAAIATLQANQVIDEANIAALAAAQPWNAVSGAFVITTGNYDVDVTSAPASATMPASPAAAEAHMFKVNLAATNNLTLTRAGAQTIEQDDGTFANTYVFAKSFVELGFFYETGTSRWRLF